MVCVELGGELGESVVGADQLDGQLGDFGEDFAGHAGTFSAPDGVVDFAPVHNAHEQRGFTFRSTGDEVLDFGGDAPVLNEVHEGAGVEDDAFHSCRTRVRD